MKKISTPKSFNHFDRKEDKVVAPSEKTLDFLKQFAHSYYVDRSLPETINGFCAN